MTHSNNSIRRIDPNNNKDCFERTVRRRKIKVAASCAVVSFLCHLCTLVVPFEPFLFLVKFKQALLYKLDPVRENLRCYVYAFFASIATRA